MVIVVEFVELLFVIIWVVITIQQLNVRHFIIELVVKEVKMELQKIIIIIFANFITTFIDVIVVAIKDNFDSVVRVSHNAACFDYYNFYFDICLIISIFIVNC